MTDLQEEGDTCEHSLLSFIPGFWGTASALPKPPPSPIASLLTLASSKVFPSSFPGEVSLRGPGFLGLCSSYSVLNDLLPQNTRGGGGTSLEGLQLGGVLCSCAWL